MKTKIKITGKIVSMLLVFCLVATLFTGLGAFTASAVGTEASGRRELDGDCTYWYSSEAVSTYTSGTGTVDDPFIITTAAQLRHLARGNMGGGGKYYKLGCDIVINDSTNPYWYEESGLKNWIKGTDDTYGTFSDMRNVYEMGGRLFRDNFDGDGHTISGLYINYNGTGRMNKASGMSSRNYCGWGLFPLVYGATFKNVKLKDVYIKSNVTAGSDAKNDYHGYGALVGNVHGTQPTTFENVQVENVNFDIARPSAVSGSKPVGVGGIIGYSYGNLTVTDAIVKNVKVSFKNYYCTSRSVGYAGAIAGAVGYGRSVTATNVITVGAMNPLARSVGSSSSGGAVTIQSENTTKDIVTNLEASISVTNCYAIGAISVHDVSGLTLVADEDTFISSNLDTFYANKGSSTNWAAKKTGKMARLASYPVTYGDVLKCDFSNYTTKADYNNSPNASTYWTIVTDSDTGSECLRGNLPASGNYEDYAFTITPNYAIGNGSSYTGYYQWGLDGPLQPGKIFKLEFKAKGDSALRMKYNILNGYSYSAGNNNRGEHLNDTFDNYNQGTASLTTSWQTFSIYFTAEYYLNDGGQGTNRPVFQVNFGAVGGHSVYFDDMVLSTVNGVSFATYDDNHSCYHYFAPYIGDDGDDISLDQLSRDGYALLCYTDSGLTSRLDTSTTKIGDIDILYPNWEQFKMIHFPALCANNYQVLCYKGGAISAGVYRFTVDECAVGGIKSDVLINVNSGTATSGYNGSMDIESGTEDILSGNKRTIYFRLWGDKTSFIVMLGNRGRGLAMDTYYKNPQLVKIEGGNPTGDNLIENFTANNIVLQTETTKDSIETGKWTSINWANGSITYGDIDNDKFNPVYRDGDYTDNGTTDIFDLVDYKNVRCGNKVTLQSLDCDENGKVENADFKELINTILGRNVYTLKNTRSKLVAGDTVNVAYIGGSVTGGTGSTDASQYSWRARTTAWLSSKYPNATVNEINMGIGGTGSYLGAARFENNIVSRNPDLVFVEFAVNDGYNSISTEQTKQDIEYMIRSLNDNHPYCDMVFVMVTDRYKLGTQFTKLLEIKEVADYYGIPIIDVGVAMSETLGGSTANWDTYYGDMVHPNDDGYAIYANAVESELSKLLVSGNYSVHRLKNVKYSLYTPDTVSVLTRDSFDSFKWGKLDSDWGANHWFDSTDYEISGTPFRTSYSSCLSGIFPKYIYPLSDGADLTFTVQGTSIGILGNIKADQTLTVNIDGTDYVLSGSNTTNMTEYPVRNDLANVNHTVTITANGSGPYVAIAAVVVGN